MSATRRLTAALAVVYWMAAAEWAHGGDPDALRRAATRYFDSVESVKTGKAAPEERQIEMREQRLDELAQGDPRVAVAKMLGAIRLGQFFTANKQFETLPRDYRRSPLVLKAKIWSSIGAKDDVGAQREMVLLIHWAGADKEAEDEKAKQAAEFAGAVYGYLAGPAKRPQADREKHIKDRLAQTYRPAFRDGRQRALEQFATLGQRQLEARKKAIVAERKRREQELAGIASKGAQLTKQLEPLQAQLEQLEAELNAELVKQVARSGLLTRRLHDNDQAIARLGAQIPRLKERIEELLALANDTSIPPEERAKLRAQAAALEVDLRRIQTELASRQTDRQAIQAERDALDLEIAKVRSRADPERKKVNELRAQLDALQQRATELRTSPITGNSPEVVALVEQATALETYLPGFWDSAKEMVLESFD